MGEVGAAFSLMVIPPREAQMQLQLSPVASMAASDCPVVPSSKPAARSPERGAQHSRSREAEARSKSMRGAERATSELHGHNFYVQRASFVNAEGQNRPGDTREHSP